MLGLVAAAVVTFYVAYWLAAYTWRKLLNISPVHAVFVIALIGVIWIWVVPGVRRVVFRLNNFLCCAQQLFERDSGGGSKRQILVLTEEADKLRTELHSLRKRLASNQDKSDLKGVQIQALTSWNVESRAAWSKEKATLQETIELLRQTLTSQEGLEEKCALQQKTIQELMEQCESKERRIDYLRQVTEGHERPSTKSSDSDDKQKIAELTDKLAECHALLAASPSADSFFKSSPPPYDPPMTPLTHRGPRRPVTHL